ncbi:MAG: hypothetical protein ACW9XA_05730 [Candidatus Nitrosopumilus sp. bin_6a]
MLDLTTKQAEIIKVFIEQYRDESNKISKGITAKGLEKYGIEPKTFRNHSKYFLENYFLRLTKTEYHGGENYFCFQITRLGILAYLKWQSTQKISSIDLDRDFFPLLFKYWGELVESYEQVLFDVLRKTLERIDIRPELEGKIQDEVIFGGKLDESIVIPMGMVEVKIFRKYSQPEVQEIPTKMDWGVSDTFESLNHEIDDKITERFTFLLFFNLLHVGTSSGELTNLYLQNNIEYDKNNTIKQSEEEIKSIVAEFQKRTLENVDKLFSIINQDMELHYLMKSTIKEITDMLTNRKTVQAIFDKLD